MNELPYFPQLDNRIVSLDHERQKRTKRAKRDFNEYQHSIPFNRIIIGKDLMLAPNGSHARRNLEAKDVDHLVNTLLDKFKEYSGLQRFSRATYDTALRMLLANASVSAAHRAQIVIGRSKGVYHGVNPKRIDVRTTNALLDFLADENLIAYHIGKGNEYQENCSWFVTLPKLMNMLEHAKVMGASKGYIVLHDHEKRVVEWSRHRSVQLAVARMEKEMETYCSLLFESEITIAGIRLIPFAKRVFNISLDLGGRLYADWEVLSKQVRAKIRINNSKTVELDYSQIHYNILYAQEGIELVGDPYIVDGYDRDTIKRVSLVMLNTENLVSLKRQITNSAKPKIKAKYAKYKETRLIYEHLRGKGIGGYPMPKLSDDLRGFVEGMPEGTNGGKLLAVLLERHKPIAHRLGTKDIGLKLQFADSKVIMQCVNEATALGIPVLPVHDSLICQARHKGLIYGIMREAFKAQYGQEIEVKT